MSSFLASESTQCVLRFKSNHSKFKKKKYFINLDQLFNLLFKFYSKIMATLPKLSKIETATTKIGTHNGSFHCDEVLACFMLKQLPEYQTSAIVRSRDPAKLEQCDIVVDVGGIFDLEKKRFDHHQKTFCDTFSSLVPSKEWKIKLSSAGLVYVYYGKQVIRQILLGLLNDESLIDEKLVDILYDKMYENFVKEIDAIDNGVEIAENKVYSINTNLSARVSFLNPDWNSQGMDEESQFNLALNLVGNEFIDRVKYYALSWWPARSIVTKAVENRFNVHSSGSILVIEPFAPWKSHLFDIEKELNLVNDEIKYVMYKDSTNDTWRIQCVSMGENSFKNRLSLPAEWCGLRDDVLSNISNINGCIFVHMNGFIGGNKTYEGALEMLQKSLVQA